MYRARADPEVVLPGFVNELVGDVLHNAVPVDDLPVNQPVNQHVDVVQQYQLEQAYEQLNQARNAVWDDVIANYSQYVEGLDAEGLALLQQEAAQELALRGALP